MNRHTALRKSSGFIVYCGCSPLLPDVEVKEIKRQKTQKRFQLNILDDSSHMHITGVMPNQGKLYYTRKGKEIK